MPETTHRDIDDAVVAPEQKLSNAALSVSIPPEFVVSLADAVAARLQSAPMLAVETPGDRSRLALSFAEAADSLGMSVDHFRRHVLPDLRVVRSGRLRLVPIAELDGWIERNAARALEAVA